MSNVEPLRRPKPTLQSPIGSLLITVHNGEVTLDSHGLSEDEAYVLLCEAIDLVHPRPPKCPA